jgi:5-formyltetrahydrofolate cyclo-ligase
MSLDRNALRQQLRERRRSIPAPQRIAAADALASRLLALPFAPAHGYVAGYWSMAGEIGLHSWQLRLPPGLVYCLPVLHEDRSLRFAPWRPGDGLVTNRYGIPEPDIAPASALPPSEMTMVVLPLVGFDDRGQRLGMGGGWYDRSFAFRQTQAAPPWLVGVGFSAQRTEALPVQPWDVGVDAVCTEDDTLLFAATSTGLPA